MDKCFSFDNGSVSICAQYPFDQEDTFSGMGYREHQARNKRFIVFVTLNDTVYETKEPLQNRKKPGWLQQNIFFKNSNCVLTLFLAAVGE
jgi:hypothetical protein